MGLPRTGIGLRLVVKHGCVRGNRCEAKNSGEVVGNHGFWGLGYAACSTILLVLPSDKFETGSVATVSSLSGIVTGSVTIAAPYSIGAINGSLFVRADSARRSSGPRSGGDCGVRFRAKYEPEGGWSVIEDLNGGLCLFDWLSETASAAGPSRSQSSSFCSTGPPTV